MTCGRLAPARHPGISDGYPHQRRINPPSVRSIEGRREGAILERTQFFTREKIGKVSVEPV